MSKYVCDLGSSLFIVVQIGSLLAVYNIPKISQVYMLYRAKMSEEADFPKFSPGVESLDVKLFSLDEIPWESLAFPAMKLAIQHYLKNKQSGVDTAILSSDLPK